MVDIFNYHWVWYLLGFMFTPRLTVMIWVSIYFANIIPLSLLIVGWVLVLMSYNSKGG